MTFDALVPTLFCCPHDGLLEWVVIKVRHLWTCTMYEPRDAARKVL